MAAPAAAFEVELDTGNAEPIDPYVERFADAFEPVCSETPDEVEPPDMEPPEVSDKARGLLPIETEDMAPGALEADPDAEQLEHMAELPRPLCLIGSDPQSLSWLKRHRGELREAGAVCVLVEAQEAAALKRVRDLADGVWVQVGSGDGFVEHFGVRHYPVVLTTEGPKQ